MCQARGHQSAGAGLSVAGLDPTDRFNLLNRVLSADLQVAPATRLSAALILLFGVRPHQITGLRLADVDRHGAKIHIRFGSEPLLLPEKIAELAAEVCQERRASRMISVAEDDEWLLPGTRPGYALSPAALTKRLRLIGVSPQPARTGAMVSLAQELPPVILARLTGLSITNAIRWTEAVAASNARYASFLVDR